MKILKSTNVYEEAKNRIRYLYDEFPNVVVSFSGGKDSTVCLNLCLEIAREKNRLPQKVLFIDQEAEWQATIEYIDQVMHLPEVEPLWFQMPLKIFNASSHTEKWLMCWNPEDESNWMREKSPISIKENTFGTDRFHPIFDHIIKKMFYNIKTCNIGGVRAEESPLRRVALTTSSTYKHITYGKKISDNLQHYTIYPVYDWSYKDVWKYIYDNNILYNKIYDLMYNYGVPIKNMRVSNLNHETALENLWQVQELEPETFNKIIMRIDGINSTIHFGKKDFYIYDLPYMFKDWKEYRDYLLDKLISNDEDKRIYKKKFDWIDAKYSKQECNELMYQRCVNTLILNDFEFTILNTAISDMSKKRLKRYGNKTNPV